MDEIPETGFPVDIGSEDELVGGRRFGPRSKRNQKFMLGVGLALFVGAVALAFANLPSVDLTPNWWLLTWVLFLLAPITVALGAIEFVLTARVVGGTPGWGQGLTISVIGSAANLLPIPGSYLVRSRAIRDAGTATGRAFGSPAAVGLIWVAVAAVVAGGVIALDSEPVLGITFLAGGAILLAAATSWLWRMSSGPPTAGIVFVVLIELAMVAVAAARYWVVLAAFGLEPDLPQSVALAVSSVLATAVGIIPGGLGLREVLAAAFSPIVGLDPVFGVLAATTNRIMGLVVLAAFAIGVLLVRGKSTSGARR